MSGASERRVDSVSKAPNKRRNIRIKTRFETLVASSRQHGAGILADISYSGALLEKTSLQPEVGSEVRVYVFLQPVSPFELVGRVVRHTGDGFAIEYGELEPDIRRMVDDAAALVAIPEASE
jgi:hypothetical protein